MPESFDTNLIVRLVGAVRPAICRAWRFVRKLVLGRRFIHSLELNQEAADRLDNALKEMLER